MNNADPHRTVRNLVDNVSDTQSWKALADELEKYVSKVGADAPPNNGETIDLRDLLTSIEEREDEQDELLPNK